MYMPSVVSALRWASTAIELQDPFKIRSRYVEFLTNAKNIDPLTTKNLKTSHRRFSGVRTVHPSPEARTSASFRHRCRFVCVVRAARARRGCVGVLDRLRATISSQHSPKTLRRSIRLYVHNIYIRTYVSSWTCSTTMCSTVYIRTYMDITQML